MNVELQKAQLLCMEANNELEQWAFADRISSGLRAHFTSVDDAVRLQNERKNTLGPSVESS
jgi:hypothetical protein